MSETDAVADTTTDQIFTTLSNVHRRRILVGLLEETPTDPPVNTATFLDDAVPGDGDRLDQYHVHLPHLEDHDFITWDRDAETVAQGPRFDKLQPTLGQLDDEHEVVMSR